jgi:hypothetical protein
MTKIASLCAALLIAALFGSNLALADKATLKANLQGARERLLKVVKGEGDAPTLIAEIQGFTPKIEAEIDTVPGLKEIWTEFKANRDGKIIPAFDGTKPGDKEAATALATGRQKELFQKMMQLLE